MSLKTFSPPSNMKRSSEAGEKKSSALYENMASRVETIDNDEEFVKRIEKAKADGSKVIVDFTAQYAPF